MAIDDSILHQYGVVRGGLSQSGSRRRGPLVEGVNGPLMEGVNGTLMEGVNHHGCMVHRRDWAILLLAHQGGGIRQVT